MSWEIPQISQIKISKQQYIWRQWILKIASNYILLHVQVQRKIKNRCPSLCRRSTPNDQEQDSK